MKNRSLLTLTGLVLLTGSSALRGGDGQPVTEFKEDLNGAQGKVFRVDTNKKCFELLKTLQYDFDKDVGGRPWHTVYWTDETRIIKVVEKPDFAGIGNPCIVDFRLDENNAKAFAAGKDFTIRQAIIDSGIKTATGATNDNQRVVSLFTPDAGPSPKSGTVKVNGKDVRASLGRRNSQIWLHDALTPGDLGKGFWKAGIQGKEGGGKFIIDRMELQPVTDPCAGDDPKLPRVLIVGDSVAFMYYDAAKAALKGIANCHIIEDNCWSVHRGSTFADYWLGDYKQKGMQWDVIQFNSGLHDLKRGSVSDPYAVPLEKYQKYLEKEVQILQRTGAKLIWCATTPVPNSSGGKYGRQKGDSVEFNKAAMEVMRKHQEIQINDLHKVVNDSPAFDKWRKGSDVHFGAAEQPILGKAVADAVIAALKSKSEKKN